jgi:hypothetical protein
MHICKQFSHFSLRLNLLFYFTQTWWCTLYANRKRDLRNNPFCVMWSYEVPRGRKNPIKHCWRSGTAWAGVDVLTSRVGLGRGCHWGGPFSVSKMFKGHTRAESSENRVNVIYTGAWGRVVLRRYETGLWSSLHQIQLSAHASVLRCADKTYRHFKRRLVFQLLS